jgi:HEAT repeat protein
LTLPELHGLVRRMTNLRLLAATLSVLLLVAGCKGDPNQPAYWEKALSQSKSKKDKLKKIEDLRSLKTLDKSFLPMLHTRLGAEKTAEVKAALVVAIGGLKDPSSVDPLIDSFDWAAADRDAKDLNKKVASALSAIGDAKAAPTLVKCLALKDNYTVIAAIDGLATMRAKEAVDPLIQLARSEEVDPFISKVAIQALGDIGNPKATDSLIEMMFKERRGVSFYVESSFALYQFGKSITPPLLGVLEGTDKARLQWAEKQSILPAAMTAKVAQVLGDLHENKAEPGLLNALKFNHEHPDRIKKKLGSK